MSVAAAMIRIATVAVLTFAGACFPTPTPDPEPETDERPVVHRQASATCIAHYQTCYAKCESSPANCDRSSTSPLCVPHPARVRECQSSCVLSAGCMPWEIGVLTGEPCRWSDDPYDCNFFLCSNAARECIEDCFDIYLLTDLQSEHNQLTCNEACYDHYGCRPRPTDPCNPLPDGYIHCACPAAHGVECHPNDDQVCP